MAYERPSRFSSVARSVRAVAKKSKVGQFHTWASRVRLARASSAASPSFRAGPYPMRCSTVSW